ncbi:MULTISPECIES: cation diffusion facilitator family transporter [unclassified Clostridium]|uniref:cation diffusion facilitator family transporter n=1 Tax=unclassified Clostridium TaxID=2614128 RepID=UPI000E4DC19E|nr:MULTISPECIES: cation diffusion facilitator family transporter [unclassified Clostridium]RHP42150.1 cation transporter [Clostridium sp. AF32-12BH]RHV69720.1 cation transporter [Clostridium sp. OM02-18AC]
MINFLVKRFVKDYENVENAKVRTAYGMLASILGICCNLFLFSSKLFAGFLVNSISVMADAFNNLSDAASSIIGFVGVRMAEKPADEEHPFGHGRMEYIAAFVVAFLVVQVGFSLLKTAVEKILHPETLSFSLFSVGILVFSVLVKLWMASYNRKLGKKIHSTVMMATAADSLGDVGATSATIVSLLVFRFFHINIDGIIGLVVSVLVLIAGINIAKDTLAPLLGEAIDSEVYKKISDFVESYDGIIGSHDLIVHNYGPSRSMASIHAEVPSKVDIEVSHAVVDRIERDAMEKLGIFLVIHMDPVETDNELAAILKEMTIDVILHLDSRLTLHDFRIVQSPTRINLIFDLVVPRDYTRQMREELTRQVCEKVRERDSRCACIVTVENSYRQEEHQE